MLLEGGLEGKEPPQVLKFIEGQEWEHMRKVSSGHTWAPSAPDVCFREAVCSPPVACALPGFAAGAAGAAVHQLTEDEERMRGFASMRSSTRKCKLSIA